MTKIELLETNNSILKKDETRKEEIMEMFGYDENTRLIPQCFWGNIKNPKYIILAKNPSYVPSDDLDNKYFKKALIKNLTIDNRTDVINLLFSEKTDDGIPFELSGVSKWWRNFFGKLINDENKSSFMNDFCIINLCGYYKTKDIKITNDLIWFYENNEINEVVKNLFCDNCNLEKIISVWADYSIWNNILKKMKINSKIIVAEKTNPYSPYLDEKQLKS